MEQQNLTFHHYKEDKNMLNYIKLILDKVSFDKHLFEKELRKALKSLMPNEINQLKEWCVQKFGNDHSQIIHKCFVGYA
ncbi:MAG: hypothetical protein SNJ77_04635 [Cytophagales bacterium]